MSEVEILINTNGVVRPVSELQLPEDKRFRDAWVLEGNVVTVNQDRALELERAQMVCSRFQARAALHAAGLLSQIEAAVSQADAFVQIAWADAVEFRRSSPTIAALQSAMGMTDAQIDDLFRAALLIEA